LDILLPEVGVIRLDGIEELLLERIELHATIRDPEFRHQYSARQIRQDKTTEQAKKHVEYGLGTRLTSTGPLEYISPSLDFDKRSALFIHIL
jgi:hypothetical protein